MRGVLCLGGFMGVGKSTVGALVAARAGAPFVDLDGAIEAIAGMPVREIFAARGEATFRELEARALDEALAGDGPRVVALGGGALLDEGRRRGVLARARVVTLSASDADLAARLAPTRAARPLLGGSSPLQARVADLSRARRAAYAEAHAHVDTTGRTPDEVAELVLAAWDRDRVVVPLGARSYTVGFGDAPELVAEAVTALRPTRAAIVTDENVGPLWAASIERVLPGAPRITLPAGERNKRLAHVERAIAELVDAGVDRAGLVVALGGGVACDMAGLAAALLLRGVRWIAAPTTLLAMVDASVGGKTGVDLGSAKNAIGAFHQPSAVVVDAAFVRTQSERDFTSGLAEVVKTAAIGDADLLDGLERDVDALRRRDLAAVGDAVRRSVAVKAAIVGRDEHERGERALLNFGHTLGHALEADGAYDTFTHGEAVSLGMVAALRVGQARGVTSAALAERVTRLLAALGLPTALDPGRVARAVNLLGLDKKRRGAALRAVLVRAPGAAETAEIPLEELARAFVDAANFAPPGTASVS